MSVSSIRTLRPAPRSFSASDSSEARLREATINVQPVEASSADEGASQQARSAKLNDHFSVE